MIKQGVFWSGLLVLISIGASVYAGLTLAPDTIVPTHWNIRGEADRFGPLGQVVWLIPAINAGVIALCAVLPLIDPRKEHIRQSAGFYLTAWIGGVSVATAAHLTIIYGAFTGKTPPPSALFICVGVFLIILGNYAAKSKSNWFAGLRTPWTLSSEHAWSVGNRLLGWGFVVTGLAMIAAIAFSDLAKGVAVMIAGLVASIAVATLASYLAWRRDPDRARAA